MGRKVSVALEADITKFVAPLETSKKAVDDLGDKVDKLDRELDKIPPDAAKAAAAMKLLGGEADAAGQKISMMGEKGTKLAVLDSKIRDTRTEVRKLADEFQRTGDVDIFRKLGDAQGRLSALTKIRKEIAESIELGAKDAAEWPGLAAVGMRYAAILAPALVTGLAAAAGGALAGAAGLGVAGLGLAGAILGDPGKYKEAWLIAMNSVENEFRTATSGFSAGVFDGLSRIGPLVESWHLDKIFKDAEAYADPLFDGIEGLSTGLVKGVGALVEKGQPAVQALSDSMIILGNASESAMESIADGAQGGAMALRDTANAVGLVVQGFGKLIEVAEKGYQFVAENPVLTGIATFGASAPFSVFTTADGTVHQLGLTMEGARRQALALGHAFSEQGDDLTVLSQKLNSATLSTDTLAASMVNKLFTAVMGVDQATLSFNSSLLQVGDTFEQNGRQIDKHTGLIANNTEKGIANRESVLASVTANMQLYQSEVAAGMSAEDAAKQYDANTKKLEAQLRAAGLTTAQIDDLIGKYRDIPDTVNTTIAIEGLTQAIKDLDHTLKLMAGIKDKDVYVRIHNQVYNESSGRKMSGNSRLGDDTSEFGRIRYRAAEGMIVPPSSPGTMLFGEPTTGGEAYIPLKGISPAHAMGLAQIVGNNYGFSVSSGGSQAVTVTLAIVGSGAGYTRLLAQTLQDMQRNGQLQLTVS